MADLNMSLEEFNELVPSLCARDTAAGGGTKWTPDNPTYGHCAVVALHKQNHFKGKLLRIGLEGTDFAEDRSHYFNHLPDGSLDDSTWSQFQGKLPEELLHEAIERDRSYVFNGADTAERYAKWGIRFIDAACNDPMMTDKLYRRCIYEALQSPCQKMGKGAVLAHDDGTIANSECNRTIEELGELCTPECIRFKIASRTESMLGACAHAEERLLWDAVRSLGYHANLLANLHLYVAGVGTNGLPHHERPRPEFTCLRCAVQMLNAGIGSVNVVFENEWHRQTPEEAVKTAATYATGEKSI